MWAKADTDGGRMNLGGLRVRIDFNGNGSIPQSGCKNAIAKWRHDHDRNRALRGGRSAT